MKLRTSASARDTSQPEGWVFDIAVTGALWLVCLVPYVLFVPRGSSMVAVSVALSTLIVMPTVFRRRAPLLTMGLVTIMLVLQLMVVQIPTSGELAVPLVAYSVARWVPGPASRSVLAVGGLGALIGGFAWAPHLNGYNVRYGSDGSYVVNYPWPTALLLALLCAGLVVTPYAIGRRVLESSLARTQRAQSQNELREQQLARREQAVRIAEATSRAQIARELHDIVAHSLSVIIVQAEGGRALAAKKPERAVEVLDTISDIGREALTEMRRIVGVLRDGQTQALNMRPRRASTIFPIWCIAAVATGCNSTSSGPLRASPRHWDSPSTALCRRPSLTSCATPGRRRPLTSCSVTPPARSSPKSPTTAWVSHRRATAWATDCAACASACKPWTERCGLDRYPAEASRSVLRCPCRPRVPSTR